MKRRDILRFAGALALGPPGALFAPSPLRAQQPLRHVDMHGHLGRRLGNARVIG